MSPEYQTYVDTESIVIIMYEGLGDYNGETIDKSYHPLGRMGARLEAYKDGQLVFATNDASTLPDSISATYAYQYNSGSGIPTLMEGTYDLYSFVHKGENAFSLGYLAESVDVIRNNTPSVSSAIDLHSRPIDDSHEWARSIGCLTLVDLNKLVETLEITNFNSKYLGKIIVDRSAIATAHDLYQTYKEHYCSMIKDFCVAKPERTTEEIINNDDDVTSKKEWLMVIDDLVASSKRGSMTPDEYKRILQYGKYVPYLLNDISN